MSTVHATAEEQARTVRVRRLPQVPVEVGLGALLTVIVVMFTVLNSSFWSASILQAVLRAAAVAGLVVVGETLLLILKQIDLSVGSVVSLSAIVGCQLVTHYHLPWQLAVLGALGVGMAVGAVNALLVVWARLPALIVTLGTLYATGGLSLVISGGLQISGLPEGLVGLGQSRLLGLPFAVYLLLAVVAVAHGVMNLTVFGKSAYAIGGNERAAVRAGVPVRRYVTCAFIASGGLAGLAGILLAGRVGVADPTQGQGLELTVITAAVVGGISLFGGAGTMLGAFLGAVFIQVVTIGLVLVGLDSTLQPVASGALLIVAVAVDTLRRRARRA
ncbi:MULTISPECIES: ABC transporter permease [unclassified Nonomuraea]|uniref:ABC transporter permease n=1 Tax=unclassified Nonomuraea TaxID=2593643 RepID=UPI0033F87078